MSTNNIFNIFEELNLENGSNYKMKVLAKYQDNTLLKRVLKMAFDNVEYTYGISLQNTLKFTPSFEEHTLESALDVLEFEISTRNITGHEALQTASNLIYSLQEEDSEVLKRVIDRDIKCNIGRTNINKVFPNLITKSIYMRCGVYSEKTKKKIKFPAFIQLKADGTYREFTVKSGEITAKSRSGESYVYPVHFNEMKDFPCGIYHGEMTVRASTETMKIIRENYEIALQKGADVELLEDIIKTYNKKSFKNEEYILPRSIGNGLLNSSNPPHKDIVYDVWDYISLEEYKNAGTKIKNSTHYITRFNNLRDIIISKNAKNIKLIESKLVHNIKEALEQTSEWMNAGFEGGILKNLEGLFKNGTSTDQLKLKLCIDCEMRITGFQDGKIGSKREGKVGSILFENDEGTIKGRCSGFNDKLLDEMTVNPENFLNKVMTVQFNDLSKARGNNYYALSHPRFIEMRDDKDETDRLEKVFELREMAMLLTDD